MSNRPDGDVRSSLSLQRDERAVSELIAFILVFGIILSSVAILSVTGFQAMEDYQEVEQERNADRAMTALAENFNDVLRSDGVEQRYGELSLRGGTITVDEGVALNVSVDGEFVGDKSEFDLDHVSDGDSLPLGAFTYESDDAAVKYEGGGVVRSEEAGSVALKDPQIRYSENAGDSVAIVSLVVLEENGRSIQSQGGRGVTISVENRTSAVYRSADVNISAESGDSHGVWKDDILADWQNEHEDVDRVLVTVVEAKIEY
ncbi:DUF7289 family protein [Halopiger aswanensis]|uniref:Uncharacterized protein n=1 Tax=Halopiger aswanensis TaxID=148449 RepID=A0A419WR11_9EURY|nr:hypothetical protein [Halopiger aswanensis]RKD97858.1 hypothetical protein ATJ93_0855 [Halopiger aswanensis]